MPHQTVLRNLADAHRNMERVLTLLRLQADSLHTGDDPVQLTLLGNSVVYMRNYPGVNHHPTEEIILDKLKGHARPLCNALSEQHRGFGSQETELLRSIRNVQGGDAGSCEEVRKLGAAYCADNFSHIHDEETELFPLAIRQLSAKDWHDVETRS
ncbi:MAG TPA: hemerythrin domain-containing protein, partial [Gammaproteobacteria bacterium]